MRTAAVAVITDARTGWAYLFRGVLDDGWDYPEFVQGVKFYEMRVPVDADVWATIPPDVQADYLDELTREAQWLARVEMRSRAYDPVQVTVPGFAAVFANRVPANQGASNG